MFSSLDNSKITSTNASFWNPKPFLLFFFLTCKPCFFRLLNPLLRRKPAILNLLAALTELWLFVAIATALIRLADTISIVSKPIRMLKFSFDFLFYALVFQKTALLSVNQNQELFSCVLLEKISLV